MWFTKYFLENLTYTGKNICIYSQSASNLLKNYNLHSFPNFSSRLFYYWKTGKKAIPLKIIIKIMNENKIKKIKIDFFSIGGGNKIKFPNEKNLNFCYLLGLILGDGCLVHQTKKENRNTYSIQIYFREKQKAKKISEIEKELFGIQSSIYIGKGCYVLVTFSKPLVLILNKLYKIPIGLKYDLICVPNLILNGNKNMKICFLKGIFESDGNIYLHRKNKCVQLRQKSKSFLFQIRKIFNDLNLDFLEPYYDRANNSWLLWTSKKSLVDNFIKQIVNFNLLDSAPIAQSG